MSLSSFNSALSDRFSAKKLRDATLNWDRLQTDHWSSITDVTLTMKQSRETELRWVRIDELQCKQAFRHFMKRLNQKIFGHAADRYNKGLRVIPILEKAQIGYDREPSLGRWHYHAAIEPPERLTDEQFGTLMGDCWRRTHWGYDRMMIRQNADRGWIDYMFKFGQKSELEVWSDCIDWDSLFNPAVGA